MTTEVIMERDKDGVTKIDGITFQVPTDRTALSMLTTKGNRIQDGDVFAEDGWVYKNGVKVRKWFVRFSSNSYPEAVIWEPKLENILHLESRRWHFHKKAKDIINPMWEDVSKRIKDAGTFKGYHRFSEGAQGYIVFNRYTEGVGISWGWCNEEEGKQFKANQQLVSLWFHYEDTCRHYMKPFWLYDAAFMRAIHRKYWLNIKNNKLHLIINGRDYWFIASQYKYDDSLVKLSSPEDTEVITETL